MAKIYSEWQVVCALQAAERANPAPHPGTLSRPVSQIAEVFASMVYQRLACIEVKDPALIDLIDQYAQ